MVEKFSLGWLAGIAIIYSIPMLVLGVILFAVGDIFFGLATMTIHILVLLIAFDRTQPGKLANDFIEKWKAGDMNACVDYLAHELVTPSLPDTDDREAVGRFFSKQLTYRCFEKMFVMFFWYMCTGPLGILFCYITYQLRDSHREGQLQSQVRFVALVIHLLEWLPARLLALAFSLAGNFVQCFENVRASFWQFDRDADNAELLYGCANCAISGMASGGSSHREPSEDVEDEDIEVAEIRALLGLLERSQAIWLSVLALITILGL
jgi:AmpE protein